jgi:Nucleotidyl transferase AbiEii toxin, Type IV TA system
LLRDLGAIIAEACARNGFHAGAIRVEPDAVDRQTLLLIYPSISPADAYITKSVKIESGAKSALDPNSQRTIAPYVDGDLPTIDLTVSNVTIVAAERTFWDKVVILHGLRRWYAFRGQLRGNASRGIIMICISFSNRRLAAQPGPILPWVCIASHIPEYSLIALTSTSGPRIHRPLLSAQQAA